MVTRLAVPVPLAAGRVTLVPVLGEARHRCPFPPYRRSLYSSLFSPLRRSRRAPMGGDMPNATGPAQPGAGWHASSCRAKSGVTITRTSARRRYPGSRSANGSANCCRGLGISGAAAYRSAVSSFSVVGVGMLARFVLPPLGETSQITFSSPVTFTGTFSHPTTLFRAMEDLLTTATATVVYEQVPFDVPVNQICRWNLVSATYELQATPEPTTLLLWGTGAAGFGLVRRTRSRAHARTA